MTILRNVYIPNYEKQDMVCPDDSSKEKFRLI